MNSLFSILLAVFLTIPLTAGQHAPDQQSQEKKEDRDKQLRLKVELVQVRAVISDKRGEPVGGLSKEDFEVLEDNRPQQITFFSVENVGSRSESRKPSDVPSLRMSGQNAERTIVLFVDTVHTTFASLAQVKRALRRFVDEQMTDRDLVALVTTSASLGLMEQFTSDRQLLRAAIDRLVPWRVSIEESLFTPYLAAQISRGDRRSLMLGVEIIRSEDMMPREVRSEIIEPRVRARANQILLEASYRRKATLATLKGVVERAAEMPGQRMIVLFSEGFTLSATAGDYEAGDLQPAINRAVRSGVIIYAIAAQGLQPVMIPASQPGIVPGRRREDPALQNEVADLTSTLAASERDLETGLITLARNTGGEAFFNTNDLSGRLQKALGDNGTYYAIAYHAPNEGGSAKDNQLRVITVRVKNHPEYKIRTQRGYQSFEAAAEEQPFTPRQRLAQALGSALPATAIPVAVSADYFERESLPGQAYIQLCIDAGALQYREQDQHYLFDLETVITIYDLTGKRVHISTNVANGKFTADRLALAKRNGYRYVERVSLKPGLYQARVGVLEPSTERIGTASAWLEVPDLTKGALTMSALLLTREFAQGPTTVNSAAEVESLSPAVTQGVMIYRSGGDLDYHLVIHPGAGKEAKTSDLEMQVEVAQADRPIFQSQWTSIESRVVEKDQKGIEIGGSLKLHGLTPGVYQLRVAVRNSNSRKPIQRIIFFGVEP